MLLYLFTVVTTLALVGGLPVLLISLVIEHRRTGRKALPIFLTFLVAACFMAGGFVGWSVRPFPWEMPFWETASAAVDVEKYGHALEFQAERVLLYVLFTGDIGAVAAGVAAVTALKWRARTMALSR